MGAPPEVIEAERKKGAEENAPFEVFAENWDTVRVFRAMQTQWDVVFAEGNPIYKGLSYGGMHDVHNALGIPPEAWPKIFMGVQLMEYTAIPILNAPREEQPHGE